MNCFHQVVVFAILICANLLKYGDEKYHFMVCDGDEWLLNNGLADVFGTFHIMIVLIEALQCERIFFSIPHKLGYFN